MCPLIFQYRVTIVSTQDVVKRASVARDTLLSFMISDASMKSMRYPTVTIVKYSGLSSLFVNS